MCKIITIEAKAKQIQFQPNLLKTYISRTNSI